MNNPVAELTGYQIESICIYKLFQAKLRGISPQEIKETRDRCFFEHYAVDSSYTYFTSRLQPMNTGVIVITKNEDRY